MWAIWELVFRVRCFWQVSWTWGLYMWKRITFNSSPLSYPCPFRRSRHPASCALTSASTRGRSPSSASTAAKPSPRTQPTTATCGARTARRRAALARCAASTSRSRRITTSTWRFMPLISQEPCGSALDLAHVCIGLCACVFAWLCARRKRWFLPSQRHFGYVQSLDPGHISESRGQEFLAWVPWYHTGLKLNMCYPTFPFRSSRTLIFTKGKNTGRREFHPPWTFCTQISPWGVLPHLLMHHVYGLPHAVGTKACVRVVFIKRISQSWFNLFVLFGHMTKCGVYFPLICKSFNDALFKCEQPQIYWLLDQHRGI